MQPLVAVVGYDERPISPDLAIGAVTGLRQSGCRVIDIGRVTAPLWSFAIRELQADAGLFVTGAGHDASWTGCDFAGAGGCPIPEQELNWLLESQQRPTGRLSRTASSVDSCSLVAGYLQELQTHFHALRPLHVICSTASPLVQKLLQQIFAASPCRLELGSVKQLTRHPNAEAKQGADLGVLVAEDGRQCEFYDETGQMIPPSLLNRWLAEKILQDLPAGTQPVVVAADDVCEPAPGWVTLSQPSAAEFARVMNEHQAACGIDADGLFWLGGPHPVGDAIVTLAAVLRGLSWQAAPASEQLRLAD